MKFQWSEYCRPVYNPDGPSGVISNRMEKPDEKTGWKRGTGLDID